MNQTYKKNIEGLKVKYPDLYRAFLSFEKEKKEKIDVGTEEVEVFSCKNGAPGLKLKLEGREYLLSGQYIPEYYAKVWVQQFGKIGYNTTIILFGLGDGRVLEELISSTTETENIIVFEPSKEVFYTLLQTRNLVPLLQKRLGLVVDGLNEMQFVNWMRSYIMYNNMKLTKCLICPNYASIFPESYHNFNQKIKEYISRITLDRNTEIHFSESFAKNAIKNLGHVFSGSNVGDLHGEIPQDMPAIVIAAGPSLEKNINELKKAKNRAFLIAVDTALKPLLKQDIIPDIFLSVDAKKPLILFEDDRCFDIPICTQETGNPEIIRRHRGKKLFSNRGNQYLESIFNRYHKTYEALETGGSVANDAYSLAERLGIETIILVGQDLAYTNDKSHADGTFREKIEKRKEFSDKFITVEDIYGNPVRTLTNLVEYKRWYEDKIVRNSEIHVIDATEGGAKIAGTEIMTLAKAIETYCTKEFDYTTVIERLNPSFQPEEWNEIAEMIRKLPETMRELQKKARAGQRNFRRLLDEFTKQELNVEKLKRIEKRLALLNDYMDKIPELDLVLPYIKLVEYRIAADMFELKEEIQEEGCTVASKGIEMYMAIEQGIGELMPELEKIAETIEKQID